MKKLLITFSTAFTLCLVGFLTCLLLNFPIRANALKLAENDIVAEQVANEGIVLLKNSTIEGETKTLPISSNMKVGSYGEGGSKGTFVEAGAGSTYVYSNTIEYPDDTFAKAVTNGDIASFSKFTKSTGGDFDRVLYYINRDAGETVDRREEEYALSNTEKNEITWLINTYGKEKVIVLLNVVSATDTTWLIQKDVGAIVCVYNPGDKGGTAIVNVLTGKVNPSGKTVDTWAKALTDYPTSHNFGDAINVMYYEDIYLGYKWFETFDKNHEKVNYCFGFGLSYTTFEIEKNYAVVDTEEGKINLFVKVTNTGKVAGKEVVQVYFEAPNGALDTPAKELIAFEKTKLLAPNESQILQISFEIDDMAQFDDLGVIKKDAYVMQDGLYKIYAGNSVIDAGSRQVYEYREEGHRIVKQCSTTTTSLTQRLTSSGEYVKLNPYVIGDGSVTIDAAITDSHYSPSHWFRAEHSITRWVGNSFSRYLINANTTTFRYKVYVEKAGTYQMEFALGNSKASVQNDMISVYVDYTDDGVDNGTKQDIVVDLIAASQDYAEYMDGYSPFSGEFELYQGYQISFPQTGWVTLYLTCPTWSKGTAPYIDYFTISNNVIKQAGTTEIIATSFSSGNGVVSDESVNGSYVKNCKAGNYVEYTVNATKAGTYYLSLSAANVIKATENLCKVYVNNVLSNDAIKLTRTAANPADGATEDCAFRFKESSQIPVTLVEGENKIKIEFTEDDLLTSLHSLVFSDSSKTYYYTDNTDRFVVKPGEAFTNTVDYEDGSTGLLWYNYADVVTGTYTVEQLLRQLSAQELTALARLYWDQESNTNTGSFGSNLLAGTGMWEYYGIPYASTADGSVGVRFTQSNVSDSNAKYKYATCFPSITMLCSTWNKDLAEDYGAGIGKEALAVDCHCVVGPGVNIHRNPQGGRNFEYFSEDGVLSGYMVSNYILGMEGVGCMSSIKHLVANDQETNRLYVNSSVSGRALRQVYLKPFEIALKNSAPSTIMTSYNNLNGKPTWAHTELIDNIIIGEFGYKGVIESDWADDSNLAYMFMNSKHHVLSMDHVGEDAYNELINLSYRQGDITYDQLVENAKTVIALLMHSGTSAIGYSQGAPNFSATDRITCEDGLGNKHEYMSNLNIQRVSKEQSFIEKPSGVQGAILDGDVVTQVSDGCGAYYSLHVRDAGTYYLSYLLNVGAVEGAYGSFEVYIDGQKVDTFTNVAQKTSAGIDDWTSVSKFTGDDGAKAIDLDIGLYMVYVKFTSSYFDFHKIILSYGNEGAQGVSNVDGQLSNENYTTMSQELTLSNGTISNVASDKFVEYDIDVDNDYFVNLEYNVKITGDSQNYFEVYVDEVKVDTFSAGEVNNAFTWHEGAKGLRLTKGAHTVKVLFLSNTFEFGGVDIKTTEFAGNQFKATITNDDTKGTITGINEQDYYACDTDLNVTISAKAGYCVSSVTWNNQALEVGDRTKVYNFTANTNDVNTLVVTYDTLVIQYFNVSITNDNTKGTISGISEGTNEDINYNVIVSAKDGFVIDKVLWNGVNLVTEQVKTFNFSKLLNEDATLEVEYVMEYFNVNITNNSTRGTITGISTGSQASKNYEITITANQGYFVSRVIWNGQIIYAGDVETYNLTKFLDQDSTLIVEYKKTASNDDGLGGSGSNTGTSNSGNTTSGGCSGALSGENSPIGVSYFVIGLLLCGAMVALAKVLANVVADRKNKE